MVISHSYTSVVHDDHSALVKVTRCASVSSDLISLLGSSYLRDWKWQMLYPSLVWRCGSAFVRNTSVKFHLFDFLTKIIPIGLLTFLFSLSQVFPWSWSIPEMEVNINLILFIHAQQMIIICGHVWEKHKTKLELKDVKSAEGQSWVIIVWVSLDLHYLSQVFPILY